MQHPLENPSLAPYGFVFPRWKSRLKYKPAANEFWTNPEKLIARLWDKLNRSNAPHPLPIETIIHEILPAQSTANRIVEGDFLFDGKPYRTRDILVLSSVVQWLATNVGNSFLISEPPRSPRFHPEREFLLKFKGEESRLSAPLRDLTLFFTHECNTRCKKEPPFFWGDGHYYDPRTVSPRDRAVVDGLMRWLGREAGRTFITAFQERVEQANRDAWRREQKETDGAAA